MKNKLTGEQKRIAIAEACGWSSIRRHNFKPHDLYGTRGLVRTFMTVPDYLNDLNAMHEAEKMLNGSRWDSYADILRCFCPTRFLCAHATARQRADAFLIATGKQSLEDVT